MHRSLKIAVPAVIFVFLAAANASAVITGRLPAGSAFNPMTGRVYVANSGADSVTVIDGASSTVLATVPVGTEPGAIAVNTATNRVYVASFLDQSLSIIDGVSNTVVASVALAGKPASLAVDAMTGRVYVGYGDLTRVDILDASNTLVSSVTIGVVSNAHGLALAHRLYVTRGLRQHGKLVVVDTTTNSVIKTIRVGDSPSQVAVNRTTNLIYVANPGSNSMSVISGRTNKVVATIDANTLGLSFFRPYVVAVNERTNKVYCNAGIGDFGVSPLVEIDGLTRQITRRFQFSGALGTGISVDQRLGRIYVPLSTGDSGNLAVILDKELLLNASLEEPSAASDSFPRSWRTANLDALSGDSRMFDPFEGGLSFHITGAGGVSKRIAQDIFVSGPAGAVLHFEGFSKAVGASETGGPYAIVFNVYYDDGTQRTVHRQFSRGTHDWERQFGRVVAAKPFSRLSYRIDYVDQTGQAFFDALHVWMDAPTP